MRFLSIFWLKIEIVVKANPNLRQRSKFLVTIEIFTITNSLLVILKELKLLVTIEITKK